MFQKVTTKEIKIILERLESEWYDLHSRTEILGDLLYQRREEVKSLICYLKTWLEWKDYREREHYREVIKSES